MFGHPNVDHHLMGTHDDFLLWVREGAGPSGINRVLWLDNPFTFHAQRNVGLDPAVPETFAQVTTQARASGIILLAPSWQEWHATIGADWVPWNRGVECTLYTWNGLRLGTDAWPDEHYQVDALNPRALKDAVINLGMPEASPLDRLRARYRSGAVG